MIDMIEITQMVPFNSLFNNWKLLGFPLLAIKLVFKLNSNYFLEVMIPYNRRHKLNKKMLDKLNSLPMDQEVLCDMLLCEQAGNNEVLGFVCSIKSSLYNLLLTFGLNLFIGTRENTPTVQDNLNYMTNDYSIWEIVSSTLGMRNLATGIAPVVTGYPYVSVVIPGYGIHNTINQVLFSINNAFEEIGLSKAHWEGIVVDDNNTVPISTVIKENYDNIRIIRSNKQLYSGKARNLGIEIANGDYVLFLDGDTMLETSYIKEHLFRHMFCNNLITVSLREYLNDNSIAVLSRKADISKDTRMIAYYEPGRIGLVAVSQPMTIKAIEETNCFRNFGFGKKIGPIDLPFMVKGNNVMVSRDIANVMFPSDYIGYGPEDIMFAAKAIAQGCMVIPILSTGVYHINHPLRSGSTDKRDNELIANLERMKRDLLSPAWSDWEEKE